MAHLGLTLAYVELNARRRRARRWTRAGAGAPTEHDKRQSEARALQMAAEEAPGDAAKLAAYRAALDAALVAVPGDEELWLLRGQAESPDPGRARAGKRRRIDPVLRKRWRWRRPISPPTTT